MPEDSTYSISVSVQSSYVAEQSAPDKDHFVFIYVVTIRNNGTIAAKLLNRHWFITDAHGNAQEVQGAGVIGQQPYLKPGEVYEYTSGAVLNTPIGSMHGSYEMVADDGVHFNAPIPAFRLTNGKVSLH